MQTSFIWVQYKSVKPKSAVKPRLLIARSSKCCVYHLKIAVGSITLYKKKVLIKANPAMYSSFFLLLNCFNLS